MKGKGRTSREKGRREKAGRKGDHKSKKILKEKKICSTRSINLVMATRRRRKGRYIWGERERGGEGEGLGVTRQQKTEYS